MCIRDSFQHDTDLVHLVSVCIGNGEGDLDPLVLYQLDIALQVVLLVAAGPDIGGDSGGLIAVPLVQVELHGDGLARVDRGRKHGACLLYTSRCV